MNFRLVIACALLVSSGTSFAQDLLSCSPNEARTKPLAICAAAVGGCAAAEAFAPSSERGFLQGQACEVMVSQITGQRYDLSDFLGSAIMSGLNSAANDSMKNGDMLSGMLVKGGLMLVKLWQFNNCLDSAKAMCETRYKARFARGSEPYRDYIRSTVYEYYGHLSNGDQQSAALKLTPSYSEQIRDRLAIAPHKFQVNDISVLDCTEYCHVSADITAVPAGGGRQQKWIMSIDLAPTGDGRWLISKLAGRDIYRELRGLAKSYGDALTDGNYDAAAALWLAPPEKLRDLINNKNSYVIKMAPEKSDQLNAFMKVDMEIIGKSNASRRESWSGTSAVVNDNGAWKFVSLSLAPSLAR